MSGPPQPGYDAMADLYAATFPDPYLTALERHAVAAFAEMVADGGVAGVVVDVGCGLGQVTDDLSRRGLAVIGIDPSAGMLTFAREKYPSLDFSVGDATLDIVADVEICAILARFSLIHVPPADIPMVLRTWHSRLSPSGVVLIAGQANDDPGVIEFDHRVARAWRWHPDDIAEVLSDAGFDEVWRTVSRPDTNHRFAEFHLLAQRR